MNTMEITKIVGALAGSLLIFLLVQFAGENIFYVGTDAEAYEIALPEGEDEPAAEEEVDVAALMAAADPSAGANVWRRCSACHTIEDGENRAGPHLHGVVERDIASVAGFSFSDALTSLEEVWDYEALFGFLASPRGYAPGTSMNFAGLSNPQERANVIAYIEEQSQ